MSRHKSKKNGKSGFRGRLGWQRPPPIDLDSILEQADKLIDADRAEEAVALLEPLANTYPREAALHYYLAYARVKSGDIWAGLAGYERAFELSRDPGYWLPLASLYLELGLNAHALNAFQQVLKHEVEAPAPDQIRQVVASLEADVANVAGQLNLPVKKMEQGLRYLEEGQRALHRATFGTVLPVIARPFNCWATGLRRTTTWPWPCFSQGNPKRLSPLPTRSWHWTQTTCKP